MISGFTLAFIDLILWVWFAVHAFSVSRVDILTEGLWGMMVFHFPSSMALPIFGDTIVPFFDGVVSLFSPASTLFAQFLIVFMAGITQYFLVGYLIGWIILFFKKKLGKQEDDKKPEAGKDVAVAGKIKKSKIVLINLVYLIFSISIFQLIQGYLYEMLFYFAMFKMNHPPSNILMNLAIVFLWGVFSFYAYKFDKKVFEEDKWNLIYILIPLLVIMVTWIFIN
jgi:hypothetical protein